MSCDCCVVYYQHSRVLLLSSASPSPQLHPYPHRRLFLHLHHNSRKRRWATFTNRKSPKYWPNYWLINIYASWRTELYPFSPLANTANCLSQAMLTLPYESFSTTLTPTRQPSGKILIMVLLLSAKPLRIIYPRKSWTFSEDLELFVGDHKQCCVRCLYSFFSILVLILSHVIDCVVTRLQGSMKGPRQQFHEDIQFCMTLLSYRYFHMKVLWRVVVMYDCHLKTGSSAWTFLWRHVVPYDSHFKTCSVVRMSF